MPDHGEVLRIGQVGHHFEWSHHAFSTHSECSDVVMRWCSERMDLSERLLIHQMRVPFPPQTYRNILCRVHHKRHQYIEVTLTLEVLDGIFIRSQKRDDLLRQPLLDLLADVGDEIRINNLLIYTIILTRGLYDAIPHILGLIFLTHHTQRSGEPAWREILFHRNDPDPG